jgi:gamma-tubulin complex component 4
MGSLPPGVSLATAETCLFIGKAVRLLQRPMRSAASGQAGAVRSEILSFSLELQRLQAQDVFWPVEFDNMVERMRSQVALSLWDLLCNTCDLVGQFDALKSYFLLAKGDFWHQFLHEVGQESLCTRFNAYGVHVVLANQQ